MSDPITVVDVDVEDALSRVREGAVLLDVREPSEWEAGHVEGATHVPLGDLDPAAWPQDRETVVICRSGNRSGKAAALLGDAGRRVVNVAGGMKAYAAAGHPVVTHHGSPGSVE